MADRILKCIPHFTATFYHSNFWDYEWNGCYFHDYVTWQKEIIYIGLIIRGLQSIGGNQRDLKHKCILHLSNVFKCIIDSLKMEGPCERTEEWLLRAESNPWVTAIKKTESSEN